MVNKIKTENWWTLNGIATPDMMRLVGGLGKISAARTDAESQDGHSSTLILKRR